MTFWTLLAVLAIACLLPIFAKKSDNDKVTAGSICENELGQCMVKEDEHQCMLPLTKLDCPDGMQCCKTIIPKDYEAAGLPLKALSCEKHKKCTKKGGKCISSKQYCEGTKNKKLCPKNGCTCCYLSTDDKFNSVIKKLEKLSSEMANCCSEVGPVPAPSDNTPPEVGPVPAPCDNTPPEVGPVPAPCDNTPPGSNEKCGMLNTDPISSDPLNYINCVIPKSLLAEVLLCPSGTVLVTYEIPSFQSYDPRVTGFTCTNNAWVLNQHALGFTNCHMGLQYNTDFWYNDALGWLAIRKPYYEAMRNCYAHSCNGLVCTDDFGTCWLKINTPVEGHGVPFGTKNRNFWTTVCQ